MNGLDKISKATALKYVQYVTISSSQFEEFLVSIKNSVTEKNESKHTDSGSVRESEPNPGADSGTISTTN